MIEVKLHDTKLSGTIKINVPESFNELTPAQLLYIGSAWNIWLKFYHVNKIMMRQRYVLLKKLLGIKRISFFSRKRAVFNRISIEDVAELIPLTDFIFVKNDLTKTIIRTISRRFTSYYGPSDGFANTSILEFATLDMFYLLYRKTKNEIYLTKMLAVMYRPLRENYNEERDAEAREDFNKNIYSAVAVLSAREKRFEKMPYTYKHAALIYFIGIRNKVERDHEWLFKKELNKTRNKKKGGWGQAIFDLSGTKFGDLQKTEQQNMWEILKYLDNELAPKLKVA